MPKHIKYQSTKERDVGMLTAYFFLESDQTIFSIVLALGKRMGLWSRLGFTLPLFQILGNFEVVTLRVPSMQAKHILLLERTKAQRGHKNCS